MVIKYNYNGNIINSYNFLGYGDVSMKKIEIINLIQWKNKLIKLI